MPRGQFIRLGIAQQDIYDMYYAILDLAEELDEGATYEEANDSVGRVTNLAESMLTWVKEPATREPELQQYAQRLIRADEAGDVALYEDELSGLGAYIRVNYSQLLD